MGKIWNQNGNALFVVLTLTTALSLAGFMALTQNETTSSETSQWLEKKRTEYFNEGMNTIAKETLKKFISDDPTASAQSINDNLNTVLGDLATNTGYKLDKLEISAMTDLPAAPLPNGAFRGLVVPQRLVDYNLKVTKETTHFKAPISSSSSVSMNLFQVSMFQFMAFSDLDFIDYHPGPRMNLYGRVHANGDICLSGSTDGLWISQLTSAAKVMLHSNSKCQYPADYSSYNVFVSSTGINQNFMTMRSGADSGCTNCNSTGKNWGQYARDRWGGHLEDSSHGITPIRLPFAKTAWTQMSFKDGRPTDNSSGKRSDNHGKLRFLIDPVNPYNLDSTATRNLRFSEIADIRIIDGVWFIKNPDDPLQWPGLPIWSDHPGKVANLNSVNAYQMQNVGQQDIRDLWASKGRPWASVAGFVQPPRLFSYYEYNPQTGRLSADNEGVLSYGSLARTGNVARPLSPGFFTPNTPINVHDLCNGERVSRNGGPELQSILAATAQCLSNGVLPAPPVAMPFLLPMNSRILASTRGGFRNPHTFLLSRGTTAEREGRSRVFPKNFDVAALQIALQNANPGELGTYFGDTTSFMKRRFNGVVYISSSWPGALTGFQSSDNRYAPTQAPFQGGTAANNPAVFTGLAGRLTPAQAAPLHASQQQALPYTFCSDAPADGGLAGTALDDSGGFKIPFCSDYLQINPTDAIKIAAYPNAVRIINGANFDRTILTKGLTIASNLGVYIAGDYNTSSNVAENAPDWVPALVAGDQILVQSNAWEDRGGNWADPLTSYTNRNASTTRLHTAFLTGWTKHPDPNGGAANSVAANTFPGQMETWAGDELQIWGAFVFGFYPTYLRHGIATSRGGISAYNPPTRNFNYDPHFVLMANQPPGSPLFPIAGTRNIETGTQRILGKK